MTFGEKLVHYRTKKQMTQKALAEVLNITPTRLNYWEKDKRQPDVEMIRQLSEVLEVSADVLIGYKEETKKAPAPKGAEDESSISMERSNRLYDALVAAGLIVDDNFAPEDMKFLMHIADVIEDWFARKQAQ